MNKTLLATSALALVAAQASAVDVELYGQVNKALVGFDDGVNTDFVIVDNDYSSTRFGFKGAQALDNGLTASALFEIQSQSNESDAFTQTASAVDSSVPGITGGTFAERQSRVGLSGNFGGVYIGRQSTAIDGLVETDLTGAQDIMTADFTNFGGGLEFRNATTGALTGTSVQDVTFSGLGVNIAQSVRYDSPIVAGFQGRASVAQGGDTELGVVYEGGYADFKMAGSVGYRQNNDAAANVAAIEDELVVAGSVVHSSGLGATLAYTAAEIDNAVAGSSEPTTWYGKVGYAWDAFEVAADYGMSEEYALTAADNELATYGLGAQYNMGNGVSLAALYRNFDAEIAGTSTESIDLVGVNMRVKF